MAKKLLLLAHFLLVFGVILSSIRPSVSPDSLITNTSEIEKFIAPQKNTQSLKTVDHKSESPFSEIAFREQMRSKFLKLISLTLGFVTFFSAETKPFSKQLTYGVLFSESYLKLLNDPSSHPLIPQAPPVV